jgi:hypothetical protein
MCGSWFVVDDVCNTPMNALFEAEAKRNPIDKRPNA